MLRLLALGCCSCESRSAKTFGKTEITKGENIWKTYTMTAKPSPKFFIARGDQRYHGECYSGELSCVGSCMCAGKENRIRF